MPAARTVLCIKILVATSFVSISGERGSIGYGDCSGTTISSMGDGVFGNVGGRQ